MKKALSLLLITAMLFCAILIVPLSASAATNPKYDLSFGVFLSGHTEARTVNASKFTLNSSTTLHINYDAYEHNMIFGDYLDLYKGRVSVIKESDYKNVMLGKEGYSLFTGYTTKGNNNRTWYDGNVSLNAGSYYLMIVPAAYYIGGTGLLSRTANDYTICVTPVIKKIAKINAETTANAVTLKWASVPGVSGYQVVRQNGSSYQLLQTGTAASFADTSLKAGTAYTYGVRGYNKVGGKYYFGAWRGCVAITRPVAPAIKTPSTNTKHQITAKWSKVSSVSGYQAQFSLKKNFSASNTTKTVAGAANTSTAVIGTKGKVYYIRVRSYKTVSGKNVFSAWSSVKSVKCK